MTTFYPQTKTEINPATIKHRLAWCDWQQLYPEVNERFWQMRKYCQDHFPKSYRRNQHIYDMVCRELAGIEEEVGQLYQAGIKGVSCLVWGV